MDLAHLGAPLHQRKLVNFADTEFPEFVLAITRPGDSVEALGFKSS